MSRGAALGLFKFQPCVAVVSRLVVDGPLVSIVHDDKQGAIEHLTASPDGVQYRRIELGQLT